MPVMTNLHRQLVHIDWYWECRSRAFGLQWCQAKPAGRASAPARGTLAARAARIGKSKAGEVAVALLAGKDPHRVLTWAIGMADLGWDLSIGNRSTPRALADVKTSYGAGHLIWPVEDRHKYLTTNFTHLIAVSIEDDDWESAWIEGQVSKQRFWRQHLVADDCSGLERGTWYMDKAALDPINLLLEQSELT